MLDGDRNKSKNHSACDLTITYHNYPNLRSSKSQLVMHVSVSFFLAYHSFTVHPMAYIFPNLYFPFELSLCQLYSINTQSFIFQIVAVLIALDQYVPYQFIRGPVEPSSIYDNSSRSTLFVSFQSMKIHVEPAQSIPY